MFINGKPAGRIGDAINCGGKAAAGSGDVFIGDGADTHAFRPERSIPSRRRGELLNGCYRETAQSAASTTNVSSPPKLPGSC
ncbi:hypothetical protein [Rhodovulum sulfidophilum]|uniref:hypothetical protein n=1 Tax=Rhodovulum sulfidophilum TaxID=35806 RepID=UPI0030838730